MREIQLDHPPGPTALDPEPGGYMLPAELVLSILTRRGLQVKMTAKQMGTITTWCQVTVRPEPGWLMTPRKAARQLAIDIALDNAPMYVQIDTSGPHVSITCGDAWVTPLAHQNWGTERLFEAVSRLVNACELRRIPETTLTAD